MKAIGKLTRNGGAHAIIIPRGKLLQLGWQPGEPVTFQVERGMLIITSLASEVDRNAKLSAEIAAELATRSGS